MLKIVLSMYITLMPTLLSGILTMIWCKLPILSFLKHPIDRGKNWIDHKRILGDHKTWYGLVGYLISNIIITILWGKLVREYIFLQEHNYFYMEYQNTVIYNFFIGILLGLAYSLFELPNSFIKRRFDIVPGKSGGGRAKVFFIFLDQADSIIGCTLVVWLMYDIGLKLFLGFIVLGAFTHIVVNILLYFLKLRKNII